MGQGADRTFDCLRLFFSLPPMRKVNAWLALQTAARTKRIKGL